MLSTVVGADLNLGVTLIPFLIWSILKCIRGSYAKSECCDVLELVKFNVVGIAQMEACCSSCPILPLIALNTLNLASYVT